MNRNSESVRHHVNRRPAQLHASASGPRRPGVNGSYIMPLPENFAQNGRGKLRRSHKYDAQRHCSGSVGSNGSRAQGRIVFDLAARRLGELLQHPLALQARNMINKKHAVEVVNLMLDAGSQQTLSLDFLVVAVPVM